MCCESCGAVVRQVVGRHPGVERRRVVAGKYAAAPMHYSRQSKVKTIIHRGVDLVCTRLRVFLFFFVSVSLI